LTVILRRNSATAGIFPITLTVKERTDQEFAGHALHGSRRYGPAGAAFMPTGSMSLPAHAHTATLLLDGRVLLAGGGVASAELYDPMSQTFTVTAA